MKYGADKFDTVVVATWGVDGEMFEAVLVTATRDFTVKDALTAADNGALIRTDEEWERVIQERTSIPFMMRDCYLVTARSSRDTISGVGVSCITECVQVDGEWTSESLGLNDRWTRYNLVLRRRADR